MDMHGAMQLIAGKEQSFVDQVKSVFQYDYFPLPMELALQQIEMNIQNKGLLKVKPVKKIMVVPLINDDNTKVGNYEPKTRTISLRETVVLRVSGLQTILHEYGHHFDEQFLAGTKARKPAEAEFKKELARVEKLLGKPLGNVDDPRDDELKVGTTGISLYSLRSDHEWVAEAFSLYFSGYPAQLFKAVPDTFKLIDDFCQGKKGI